MGQPGNIVRSENAFCVGSKHYTQRDAGTRPLRRVGSPVQLPVLEFKPAGVLFKSGQPLFIFFFLYFKSQSGMETYESGHMWKILRNRAFVLFCFVF